MDREKMERFIGERNVPMVLVVDPKKMDKNSIREREMK